MARDSLNRSLLAGNCADAQQRRHERQTATDFEFQHVGSSRQHGVGQKIKRISSPGFVGRDIAYEIVSGGALTHWSHAVGFLGRASETCPIPRSIFGLGRMRTTSYFSGVKSVEPWRDVVYCRGYACELL